MVGWTDEYQLLDLEPDKVVGFMCKKCGSYKAYTVKELLEDFDRQDYPSKVEAELRCIQSRCRGPVRIELNHGHLNEQFQGGLP